MTIRRILAGAGSITILLAALTSMSGCLSSCNTTKNVELAKQGVARFHSQLASEKYHDIYAEADEQFCRAGSETDVNAFFQAIHRKLGPAKESQLQNTEFSGLLAREVLSRLLTTHNSLTLPVLRALPGASVTAAQFLWATTSTPML